MIFMTHPEHGADNVVEGQVQGMEAHGWMVTDREAWMAKRREKQGPHAVAEQSSAAVRRGRPPKAK